MIGHQAHRRPERAFPVAREMEQLVEWHLEAIVVDSAVVGVAAARAVVGEVLVGELLAAD